MTERNLHLRYAFPPTTVAKNDYAHPEHPLHHIWVRLCEEGEPSSVDYYADHDDIVNRPGDPCAGYIAQSGLIP